MHNKVINKVLFTHFKIFKSHDFNHDFHLKIIEKMTDIHSYTFKFTADDNSSMNVKY